LGTDLILCTLVGRRSILGVKSMLRIRSFGVYAIAAITALGFSIGAKADWTLMMQLMGAGTGCSWVLLAK
jgi:hypothetical protein